MGKTDTTHYRYNSNSQTFPHFYSITMALLRILQSCTAADGQDFMRQKWILTGWYLPTFVISVSSRKSKYLFTFRFLLGRYKNGIKQMLHKESYIEGKREREAATD